MAIEGLKNVLLTGASSGIGRSLADALLAAGYRVWGTSRDPGRLATRPNFCHVRLDLNDPASLADCVAQVEREAGTIDVLINNAGEAVSGPLEALAGDAFAAQFQTLLFGPLELIRRVLPAMRQRRCGLIVNISSLAARFPMPFNGAYNAAKAALSSVSDCLRLELAGTGVAVVDVQPGPLATEFLPRIRQLASALCEQYEPNLAQARAAKDREFRRAPGPDRLAQAVVRVIRDPRHAPLRLTAGSFRVAKLGPLLARLAPHRLVMWILRRTYGLPSLRKRPS
jgi:NAD(P)-dependent dehydrogenase (short-subunit alcohol dehydrogenase family)